MKIREGIAFWATVIGGLALILLVRRFTDLLSTPEAIIALIVAAGGVFAYAKGRLDETISLLDEVAAWTYYPFYAAYPPEFLDPEYLKEMAKENASNLAVASARAARRMPSDIGLGAQKHIEMLRSFSLKSFGSNDETRDWMKRMFESSEKAHAAIQHLEQNEYRMRNWGPRWLRNMYGRLWRRYLELI
jgi:hypothetical protein